jgi:hypothetical protein
MEVERALAVRRITLLDVFPDSVGAAYVSFVTPTLPQKELEQALGVYQIRSRPRVTGGENLRLKARDGPAGSFQAYD